MRARRGRSISWNRTPRQRRRRRRGGGGGSSLLRYRLSDQRSTPFATGVQAYDVSADGHKLVYRAAGGGGGGGADAAERARKQPAPSLFLVDADRAVPAAGAGRLNATLRMYLEPKEEFKQIFYEGWRNQRDYLYVPNMHGADWPRMKEMYGQLLPYVNASRRSELSARHDGRGNRHRPLVRARRRHAVGAQFAAADCWAPISPSTTAATRSRASTITRAGIRICARRWPTPGVECRGRRLHPGDQRRRTESARQHLSAAGRHGQSADGADRQQQPAMDGRASGDRRAGGQ